MIPFWRSQFWVEHLSELVPSLKVALPFAILWSFSQRMIVGTLDALAISPTLLGLSVVMVLLDTATGCYQVIQDDDSVWNTKAFGGMIDKVLKYAILIVVFSAIASAGERAKLPSFVFAWIRDFAYLVVVVREGGSAVENLWGKPLGDLIQQFRKTLRSASK